VTEGVPTEQELKEALAKIKVSDVLVETMQGSHPSATTA